jgi:hypothetical protein
VANTGMQWGLKKARRLGWKVIEPKANELQLDLDGALAVRKYGAQYAILRKAGLTRKWKEKILPSKRKNHVHVVISLPAKIKNIERVALQAVLGSDIKREAFNFTRVKKRNKYPIVLFKREEPK